MDTIEDPKPLIRRRHSATLKTQVLAECAKPEASVARIAMAQHGLNANLVHKWRRLASAPVPAPAPMPSFIALPLAVSPAPRPADHQGTRARVCRLRMRGVAARTAAVIRIDAVWLATEPLDMRCGTDSALSRVVQVFGVAKPHHADLFANRRATRMKVLVHNGIGIWLCARRLHQGRFAWGSDALGTQAGLTCEQLQALVLGLTSPCSRTHSLC